MGELEQAVMGALWSLDDDQWATVRQVQMLGDSVHVYMTTDRDTKLVASMDGYARFAPKQRVVLHLDMDRCSFFAADAAGERLNQPLAE